MWLMVLLALACGQLSAQVLGADALKKAVPSSFFFAGQSAPVQMRNSVGHQAPAQTQTAARPAQ